MARRSSSSAAAAVPMIVLAAALAPSLLPAAAAWGGTAASSFGDWIALNKQSYAVNAALYAQKSVGEGGKTLDTSLSAAEEKVVVYAVDPSGGVGGDYTNVTAVRASLQSAPVASAGLSRASWQLGQQSWLLETLVAIVVLCRL